jgi:hypothetical protein
MTKIAKREEQPDVPWWKALTRRALRMTAATTVAVGGEKARELSNELLDAADGVAPPPPPTTEPPRLAHSALFVTFSDRLKVVNELGRLSIDCMTGSGWSHVMGLPIPTAVKILEVVTPVLDAKLAWRHRLTDARGYVESLRDAIKSLKRSGAKQKKSETNPAELNAELDAVRQDALNAIQFVGETLERLVWAFDDYARGGDPSPDTESASDEPVSGDPFRG